MIVVPVCFPRKQEAQRGKGHALGSMLQPPLCLGVRQTGFTSWFCPLCAERLWGSPFLTKPQFPELQKDE